MLLKSLQRMRGADRREALRALGIVTHPTLKAGKSVAGGLPAHAQGQYVMAAQNLVRTAKLLLSAPPDPRCVRTPRNAAKNERNHTYDRGHSFEYALRALYAVPGCLAKHKACFW